MAKRKGSVAATAAVAAATAGEQSKQSQTQPKTEIVPQKTQGKKSGAELEEVVQNDNEKQAAKPKEQPQLKKNNKNQNGQEKKPEGTQKQQSQPQNKSSSQGQDDSQTKQNPQSSKQKQAKKPQAQKSQDEVANEDFDHASIVLCAVRLYLTENGQQKAANQITCDKALWERVRLGEIRVSSLAQSIKVTSSDSSENIEASTKGHVVNTLVSSAGSNKAEPGKQQKEGKKNSNQSVATQNSNTENEPTSKTDSAKSISQNNSSTDTAVEFTCDKHKSTQNGAKNKKNKNEESLKKDEAVNSEAQRKADATLVKQMPNNLTKPANIVQKVILKPNFTSLTKLTKDLTAESSDSDSENKPASTPFIAPQQQQPKKQLPKNKKPEIKKDAVVESSSTSDNKDAAVAITALKTPIQKQLKSDALSATMNVQQKTVESAPKTGSALALQPKIGAKRSHEESEKNVNVSVPQNTSADSASRDFNSKVPRQNNEPFRRINPNEVTFANDKLRDNSFMSKSGARGSYGEKASRDLATTRGKDFRQEKAKKKRGSYRGGLIDTSGVHSIKFDSDDDN